MEENSSFSKGQSPKALRKLTERIERRRVFSHNSYGRMQMSPGA